MSYADGSCDDVDGICIQPPSLTSSSSVASDVGDITSPSPGVGETNPFHRTPSRQPSRVSGSADAYPGGTCSDGFSPEIKATSPQTSLPPEQPFDWSRVDPTEFARLRGFLCEQDWAREFYDEDDGFHIAIEGIPEVEAKRLIDAEHFPGIPIKFVPNSNCIYQECCDVVPGDRLKNTRSHKEGIYSGSIGCSPHRVYGLTAAHTIQDDAPVHDDEIKLFNQNQLSSVVSRRNLVIEEVTPPGSGRITADIRLLELDPEIHSYNSIQVVEECINNIPNGRYTLSIYEGNILLLHRKDVILRNKHRELIRGRIRNATFTSKAQNLSHAIMIEIHDERLVIEPGDSGALVLLVPPEGSSNACVVGIVLGRLRSNLSKGVVKGVVNNLCDVLRYCAVFGTDPSCRGFYDK